MDSPSNPLRSGLHFGCGGLFGVFGGFMVASSFGWDWVWTVVVCGTICAVLAWILGDQFWEA